VDLNGVWDRGRMAQVVSNLIGNALSHGEATEAVRVRLDGTESDRVCLKVSNAGSMPPSVRSRIFDPFSRSPERRSSDNGLGLGLYIVEQIVNAHGGRVWIEDDVEAQTTFALELPRTSAPS
jgi:two-component system, sensor histidine kinase and response regulator